MNLRSFPFLSLRVTLHSSSHSFQMVSVPILGTFSIAFVLSIDAVASEDVIGWNEHHGLTSMYEEAIRRSNGLDPYVPIVSSGPYHRRAMKPSPKANYKWSKKQFNKLYPWWQKLIDPKVPRLTLARQQAWLSADDCKLTLIVEPTLTFTF